MGGIFINYRRRDSEYIAGRLRNDLSQRFGADFLIFRDVDSMPLGSFPEEIDQAVRSCDAMVVVIGDGWLDARDAAGRRRLDQPEDWVRLEIAAALRQDKIVVPVLVEGAGPPPAERLPAEIRALAVRQAVELPDSRWDYEVERLVQKLARSLPRSAPVPAPPPPRRLPLLVGLMAVVMVLAVGAVILAALLGGGSDRGSAERSGTPVRPATAVEDGEKVSYVGPWSGANGRLGLTVERIDATPETLQVHLLVQNGTRDTLTLPAGGFNLIDDRGHSYRADPFSAQWPREIPPGDLRGVIGIGEPLQPAVASMRAGWGTVFGTLAADDIFVENIRLP